MNQATQTTVANGLSVFDVFRIGNRVFKPINRFPEDAKNGRSAWLIAEDGTDLGWGSWNEQFDQWFPDDDQRTTWNPRVEPYWYWK